MAKYVLLKNKVTGERSVRITGGQIVTEKDNPVEYAMLRKRAVSNRNRTERDQVMRDCGLTKVKGAVTGRTYWE
jgi:hypothetical protein